MGYIWELKKTNGYKLELDKKTKKELNSMYKSIYADLQDQEKKLSKIGTSTAALKSQQIADLKKMFNREFNTLSKVEMQSVLNNVTSISKLVANEGAELLTKIGLKPEAAMASVPTKIISNIMQGKVYADGWSLSSRIWGDNKDSLTTINRIISKGIAANASAYDIAKDLEPFVNPDAQKSWAWKKVYPNSNKQIDYNAQRLARTMVSHACTQSIVETAKATPGKKKIKWLSAMSHRSCELCKSRDGKLFELDKVPLDHPNGLCDQAVVYDKDLQETTEDLTKWLSGDANAETDAEFNEWYKQTHNGQEFKPKFTETQEKFLTPAGYTESNMPKDISEWVENSSAETLQQLNAELPANTANEHWVQTEDWYNKNLKLKDYKMVTDKFVAELPNESEIRRRTLINDIDQRRGQFNEDAYITKCNDWFDSLSLDEGNAVSEYTGPGFREMNRFLRTGLFDDIEYIARDVENLHNALSKTKTEEDLVLFRGISNYALKNMLGVDESETIHKIIAKKGEYIGNVVQDKAFISTTPVDGGSHVDFGSIELIINVPKGANGMYVDPISENQGEKEFLLNSGDNFMELLDITEVEGKVMAYLNYLI